MSQPISPLPSPLPYYGGILSGAVDLCQRTWASALASIASAQSASSASRTILERLDHYSKPTESVTVGGLEVSSAFVLELQRVSEDQLLFLQGRLLEPPQNAPEKVVADLFDLVGGDKALLRTLTEVCNQRIWIDLRNFLQDQYFQVTGEYPILNNHKLQTLSIHKDEEGAITVKCSLVGDILHECRGGRPVEVKRASAYTATSEYNLKTQAIQYQHTFS